MNVKWQFSMSHIIVFYHQKNYYFVCFRRDNDISRASSIYAGGVTEISDFSNFIKYLLTRYIFNKSGTVPNKLARIIVSTKLTNLWSGLKKKKKTITATEHNKKQNKSTIVSRLFNIDRMTVEDFKNRTSSVDNNNNNNNSHVV